MGTCEDAWCTFMALNTAVAAVPLLGSSKSINSKVSRIVFLRKLSSAGRLTGDIR